MVTNITCKSFSWATTARKKKTNIKPPNKKNQPDKKIKYQKLTIISSPRFWKTIFLLLEKVLNTLNTELQKHILDEFYIKAPVLQWLFRMTVWEVWNWVFFWLIVNDASCNSITLKMWFKWPRLPFQQWNPQVFCVGNVFEAVRDILTLRMKS